MAKDHEKPGGPMIEFYLAANAQYEKGEVIPVSVNGHNYYAKVGERQMLPKDVVDVLKNSKSKTAKVKTGNYDPDRGGVPRKQELFYQAEKDYVYQCEFDIEELAIHD